MTEGIIQEAFKKNITKYSYTVSEIYNIKEIEQELIEAIKNLYYDEYQQDDNTKRIVQIYLEDLIGDNQD